MVRTTTSTRFWKLSAPSDSLSELLLNGGPERIADSNVGRLAVGYVEDMRQSALRQTLGLVPLLTRQDHVERRAECLPHGRAAAGTEQRQLIGQLARRRPVENHDGIAGIGDNRQVDLILHLCQGTLGRWILELLDQLAHGFVDLVDIRRGTVLS